MMKKIIYFAVYLLFFTFVLTGCPKKPLIKPLEIKPTETKPTKPSIGEIPEETKVVEPEIRGKEFLPIPEVKTVYFEFDRYILSAEAEKNLQKSAEYLKKNPDFKIIVEGHCCECGTVEYNLGLGDKRAKVVRDYYIQLGINPQKIATITYGEEKPVYRNVGPPDSPQCAFNRRAETKMLIEKTTAK